MSSSNVNESPRINAIARFWSVFVGVTIIYVFSGLYQLTNFTKLAVLRDDSDIMTFFSNLLFPYAFFINALPSTIALLVLTAKLYQLMTKHSVYDDEVIFQFKKYGKMATTVFGLNWILFAITESVQYQLNTGKSLDSSQILAISTSYVIYAILLSTSAYLLWEHFGVDWVVSLRKGTTLTTPIGLKYGRKLLIIAYVIPITATLLIIQSVIAEALVRDLNISGSAASFDPITIVLTVLIPTWIPVIITTLPVLLREIQNVSTLKNSFERLSLQEAGNDFSLSLLPVLVAGDFGKIVNDYNHFITQLHARVLFTLDSAHQLESFFDDLNDQIEQLVRAQEDIAKSMEVTTNGVQQQSEALQEMTSTIAHVQNTFTQLFQQAADISQHISRLTTQIRIISLNARIEAARGQERHGATIAFIAQRITQLSEEVKTLQEQLQEEFNQRLQEFSQRFDAIIQRIQKVQEVARDNAASSEEVSASVEEATATLHATRDEAQNLLEHVSTLIRELERYSRIQQVE